MSDNGHNRRHIDFADFSLYHERLLVKGAERVPLTPRVLDMLIMLVEHEGELVSKEMLLETLWGGNYVEEGNISRAISTLRKSLGSQANGSDFIETVPKLGYRFIAPVDESSKVTEQPDAFPKERSPSKYLWMLAAAMLIAGAGAVWYFAFRSSGPVTSGGWTNLTNSLAEVGTCVW